MPAFTVSCYEEEASLKRFVFNVSIFFLQNTCNCSTTKWVKIQSKYTTMNLANQINIEVEIN